MPDRMDLAHLALVLRALDAARAAAHRRPHAADIIARVEARTHAAASPPSDPIAWTRTTRDPSWRPFSD